MKRLTMGSFVFLLLTVLSLAQPPGAEKLYAPGHAIAFAEADALTVPASRQKYCRYLSLHNFPANERVGIARVLNFLLNSFSTNRSMTPAQFVQGCENTLLRFFTDDYEMNPINLDRLAINGSGPEKARVPEPYFSSLAATTEKGEIKLKAIPTEATARLRKLCHTDYPIFRADWFAYFASLAPSYYELTLGVANTEAEFDKIIYADEKTAERARVQTKGVVKFSTVAQKNRTLTRTPTINGTFGGYKWKSHDTLTSVNDRDYMNVLLDEKFDAQEIIANLSNGLQCYFLTDGKGKRLDVAAIDIAADKESRYRDPQVWAARNCIVCHAQGLRDINDRVRGLSQNQISLQVVDPKQARRIADLYFSAGMQEVLEHDRRIYKAAVANATQWPGLAPMTPETVAAAFESLTWDYYDRPLSLPIIAREMGWSTNELEAVLRAAKGIDHTLTGLLSNPPDPVRRDQFEISYGQLSRILAAAKP